MLRATRTTDPLTRLLELGFEPARDVPPRDVVRIDRSTFRVSAACGAMGTLVAVTGLGPSGEHLDEAIGGALDEMHRLIAVFSRFETASALTQLNVCGRLSSPPPELVQVLEDAIRCHALTRGVFDVTVAPLVDLFRDRMTGPRPTTPSDAEIRDARALVGAGGITAGRREVRLGRSGMRVTLDGIAKGYIVDRMAAILDAHHVRDYLIDAGGDIRARGRNPARHPWTVAVQDPRKLGAYPDVIHLRDGAVATSGSYERSFDAAQQFHHIIEPETGRSPTSCSSVSVVARSTVLADVLATSVFIMGPERGLAFVESRSDCECLIIDRDGRELRSRGWTRARADGGGQRRRPTAGANGGC